MQLNQGRFVPEASRHYLGAMLKQLTRPAGFGKRSACTENHEVQQAALVKLKAVDFWSTAVMQISLDGWMMNWMQLNQGRFVPEASRHYLGAMLKQLTRTAGFGKRSACTEVHEVQQAALVNLVAVDFNLRR